MKINTRKTGYIIAIAYSVAMICAAHARAEQKDTLVTLTDLKEAAEKIKRQYQTSDQYRFSKNRHNPPEREELPVTLKLNQNKIFALDTPLQKFGLIAFTAAGGQPFAGLSAAGGRADFVRGGLTVTGGQYAGKNLCLLAVVPGDTGKIVAWNALPEGGGGGDSISGSVTMKNYTPEKTDTLKTGLTVWRSKAGSVKEYHITPNRGQSVVIGLQPRTGFLYAPRQGGRVMYYGGEDGAQYTIEADGGNLF